MSDSSTLPASGVLPSKVEAYLAAILSFVVVVGGGLATLVVPGGLTSDGLVAFLSLFVATFVMMIVPLLGAGKIAWVWKVGIEILGALGALLIPFFFTHDFSLIQVVLLVVGLVKAGATVLGVTVRTS